ncbi:hypothetical protein [Microbacterium deminutum]
MLRYRTLAPHAGDAEIVAEATTHPAEAWIAAILGHQRRDVRPGEK